MWVKIKKRKKKQIRLYQYKQSHLKRQCVCVDDKFRLEGQVALKGFWRIHKVSDLLTEASQVFKTVGRVQTLLFSICTVLSADTWRKTKEAQCDTKGSARH